VLHSVYDNPNVAHWVIIRQSSSINNNMTAFMNHLFLQFAKANKKRLVTGTLLPSSAQDISKENKVFNPTSTLSISSTSQSNLQQQNIKSCATQAPSKILGSKMKLAGKVQAFAKKDINTFAITKKKKVLCETLVTTAAAIDCMKSSQIPRKKIKVSPAKSDHPSTSSVSVNVASSSSSSTVDNKLANFFLNTDPLDTTMVPCCSTSVPMYQFQPASPTGSTSSASSNAGQVKITNFMPVKKLSKGSKKLKFGKPTSTNSKKLKKLATVDDTLVGGSNVIASSSASAPSTGCNKLLKKKKRIAISHEAKIKRKRSQISIFPLH